MKRKIYAVASLNILLLVLDLLLFHQNLRAFLFFGIFPSVYLAPAYLAAFKDHKNFSLIYILTVFMGWTGIGWLGAFIWSLWINQKTQKV